MTEATDTKDVLVMAGRHSAILFSGRIGAQIVRVLFGILLARALGPSQYGLYVLALATVAVLASIGHLGLKTGVVRYMALTNRPALRRGFLRAGILIPVLLGTILAAFFLPGRRSSPVTTASPHSYRCFALPC